MPWIEEKHLFDGPPIRQVFESRVTKFPELVEQLSAADFETSSDDELTDQIVEALSLRTVEVYLDQIYRGETEAHTYMGEQLGRRVRIEGTKVTCFLPFTGDHAVLKFRHNEMQGVYPQGYVDAASSVISFTIVTGLEDNAEDIAKTANDNARQIADCVAKQREVLEVILYEGRPQILDRVQRRRSQLGTTKRIDSALGIPVRARPGAPPLNEVPLRRRVVRPQRSEPTADPGVSTKDFEGILQLMRHVCRTFETTPKTYLVHDEEELRDILLAHLNGLFEGQATGETFRKSGKTDIRIEASDRSAFVSEFKIWEGEKAFGAAIDQLRGYLIWRDGKACLLVFNKHNRGFTEIVKKVSNILRDHPGSVSRLIEDEEHAEWRYMMRSRDDADRNFVLHVMLINIFDAQGV
jgi:hypothetical protein